MVKPLSWIVGVVVVTAVGVSHVSVDVSHVTVDVSHVTVAI